MFSLKPHQRVYGIFFVFALSMGALLSRLPDLQRSDVRFVKVSADLLLEQLLDLDNGPALKELKDIHAADFAALTRRYGLEVIAEKVESADGSR